MPTIARTIEVHCPICERDLDVSAFGIVRSRPSGRNLYCKSCIRKKVAAGRKVLREYRAIRKAKEQYEAALAEQFGAANLWTERVMLKLTPSDRVKNAIANGARTQREIGEKTKLHKDALGDVLANLILSKQEIKTRVIDGTRLYFLNEAEEKPSISYPVAESWCEVARKANTIEIKGERRKVA